MMRFLALAAVASLFATGCQSKPMQAEDHWNLRSASPRVGRHLLGYETDRDGPYLEHQWRKKQHVNLSFKRHFLSWNPDNPFQQDDPALYRPRPVNSLLPYPHHYLHPTGALDSILATFTPGGGEEFMEGLAITARPAGEVVTTPLDSTVGKWTDSYGGSARDRGQDDDQD